MWSVVCLKGSVRPCVLFDWAAQLMMVCVTLNVLFLMLSLCSPFINTENVNVQEKLFLSSMGLSSRPKPSHQAPVPSLLWKMFKKSTKQTSTSHSDPCLVSEYGVRGNIVRFIQDQGEAFSVWVNLTVQYIISPWSYVLILKKMFFQEGNFQNWFSYIILFISPFSNQSVSKVFLGIIVISFSFFHHVSLL